MSGAPRPGYSQLAGKTRMWWDKPNPNKAPAQEGEPFPFMKIRWVGFVVTALITIVTTWSLMTQGLNMGLDFTGGVQIEARRGTPLDANVVRTAVVGQGFAETTITPTSDGTLLIKVAPEAGATLEATTRKLETALGAGARILNAENVSDGVQIEAWRDAPFEVDVVRAAVSAQGFGESSVTPTSDGTIVIRVPLEEEATVEETAAKLETALGAGTKILKTDNVSGKVSEELFGKGVLACLLAVLAIGVYVWFRFEVKFGTGAFITTLHDVYAVIGLFSITQMAFDLTIVAGVLTVAGYSINDTVVVYDRIREMLKKYRKLPITRVIDISITSTLSRTLITSLATMLAAASMAFLGGPVLFGFAVSIVFGIIIGTYSSIFVAAPLLIHLPGRIPGAKYRGDEDAPAESAASAT